MQVSSNRGNERLALCAQKLIGLSRPSPLVPEHRRAPTHFVVTASNRVSAFGAEQRRRGFRSATTIILRCHGRSSSCRCIAHIARRHPSALVRLRTWPMTNMNHSARKSANKPATMLELRPGLSPPRRRLGRQANGIREPVLQPNEAAGQRAVASAAPLQPRTGASPPARPRHGTQLQMSEFWKSGAASHQSGFQQSMHGTSQRPQDNGRQQRTYQRHHGIC